MGQLDLAIVIRQEPGFGSLEDSELASLKAGGVLSAYDAATTCLDAGHSDGFVVEEGIK